MQRIFEPNQASVDSEFPDQIGRLPVCNSKNLTPLEKAVQNNSFDIAEMLFKSIKTKAKQASLDLHQAVAENRLDLVKALLANFGMDSDRWKNQLSALELELEIVKWSLDSIENNIIKMEKRDLHNRNHNESYHYAIAEKTNEKNDLKEKQSKLLERKRYILNIINQKTDSTLYKWKKQLINHPNTDGCTVLQVAVINGFADIVSYLIQQGADYSIEMGEGNTLLHKATELKHAKVAEVLVRHAPADRTLTNHAGVTPLKIALQNGDFETAAVLVCDASKMTDISDSSRFAASFKKPMPDYVQHYIANNCSADSKFPTKVWDEMVSLYLADINNPVSPLLAGLYVSGCNLKDAHVMERLSQLPITVKDTIKVFDLSNNNISKDSAQVITQFLSENKSLKILDLSGNPLLGDGGFFFNSAIQIIAESFEAHLSLEVINLANTGLNDYDVMAIASALAKNDTVTVLDISNNPKMTDGLATYLDKMLNSRGKSAALRVILEHNPQLSSALVKKYRRIGSAKEVSKYGMALPLLNQGNMLLANVHNIIKDEIKRLADSIDDNVKLFSYHDNNNAINPRRQNMVAWFKFAKSELENVNSLEDALQAVDKIDNVYWFLRYRTTYETSLPHEKTAFHAIEKSLEDAHLRLSDANKEYYWELNPIKNTHKAIVLAMVKNDLCKTFQLYKTTSRSLSSQLFHRKDITAGEHLLSMFKSVVHILPFVVHGLGMVFENAETAYEMAEHLPELLEDVEHSSELLERLPFITDGVHILKRQIDKLTGKERIEARLKMIAKYFSGIEAKARSERLAEEIVHYYQEQIVMLTTYDAKNFAKAISRHIQCFLLQGTSITISGSEIINWIISVPLHGNRNVQLHNRSLVLVGDLLQRTGLRCFDKDNREIEFDLKFRVGSKVSIASDGNTYGYRVADEKILIAIENLLKIYREYEFKNDGRYYTGGMISLDEDTIKKLLNVMPLRCIPVEHETVHDLVKRQADEIKDLKKAIKALIDMQSEQEKRLDILEKGKNKTASFITSDNGQQNNRSESSPVNQVPLYQSTKASPKITLIQ